MGAGVNVLIATDKLTSGDPSTTGEIEAAGVAQAERISINVNKAEE